MKKNILRLLFSKSTFVVTFLLIQLFVLIELVYFFNDNFANVYLILLLIGTLSVIYLINKKDVPEVKLAWVITILILPVFGVTLYLLLGEPILDKQYKKKLKDAHNSTKDALAEDPSISAKLKSDNKLISTQSDYIYNSVHCPLSKNTETKYLKLGEIKFEALKSELKKAKHYIFLQYFIIAEGKMWSELLEILKEKASQGLDVRVMYDDVGSLNTLPNNYAKTLGKLGIKCQVINPLRPKLNLVLQNRDHRKIVVIDGEVGFTGGINLADEYINAYDKHGHWKDCAVMLKGDAVFSLAVIFLETWCFCSDNLENFNDFRPKSDMSIYKNAKGYVHPYVSYPLHTDNTAQVVYLNILNQASEYVYINSPYFIIDGEVLNAFTIAAKRGIDIRVVTPHSADNWYIHWVTRSFYKQLIEAGVKVYEYTPGFVHSKTFVCDDEIATIGTVNLDYRSLYHNFECGVWMYKTESVLELKNDFLDTLEMCVEISIEDCNNEKWYKKAFVSLIKIVTPLF